MKKIYILVLILISVATTTKSQSILSFSVTPSNPTTADSIHVIIQCEFGSGSCDGSGTFIGTVGDQIMATGFHCVGMLTVICDDYDTVVVPPQPAGQYWFNYTLLTGQGFPCNPGAFPPVVDSTQITVTNLTEVNNLETGTPFNVYPNPSNGRLTIKQNTNGSSILKIYSMEGSLIQTYSVLNSETIIDTQLPNGLYICSFDNRTKLFYSKISVIN